MKQYKLLIILIAIIFIYENSSAYWIHQFNLEASILYIIILLFAIGYAVYNIVKCIRTKFKDKKLAILTLLLVIVMILPFFAPGGLFSKRFIYKGELFVAHLAGVAGDDSWLTLYGNDTYEYNSSSIYLKGKYKVQNDTIYFDSPKGGGTYTFNYATLRTNKSNLAFGKDSIVNFQMPIVKNKLIE